MKFDKKMFRLELKTTSKLSVLPLPELKYLLFLVKRSDNLNNLDILSQTELTKLTNILQSVSPPSATAKRFANRIDKADAFELDKLDAELDKMREHKPQNIRAEVEKELMRRNSNN
jgi:hypothetical protein